MPATNRSRGKRWVFTLNNYTNEEEAALAALFEGDDVQYGIYGRETGDSGTPHLQGYVAFNEQHTFNQAKTKLGNRVHLELSRGTPKEASDYCKKDGDYNEYGSLPTQTNSKKGKYELLVEWIQEINAANGPRPTDAEIAVKFPGLFGSNYRGVIKLIDTLHVKPTRQIGQPRDGWQRELEQQLDGQPDERSITFIVDGDGNSGKSWMARYMLKKEPMKTQLLRIGKRDDLAHSLDARKSIFIFDIPRGQLQYLQYNVLESIKDGYVFSPKYESVTKELDHNCHVVVMCNEAPDLTALTEDRYNVITVSEPRVHDFSHQNATLG